MENTECSACTGLTVEDGKCRNCGAEEGKALKEDSPVEESVVSETK